jgi:DNA repair protein RadC
MLFTVEPMINLGRPHVKVLGDGWTAVTRDRSLSAQFEHTVGVTDTGSRFLRSRPRLRQAALRLSRPGPVARMARARPLWQMEPMSKADPDEPHYHGHRDRLRARFAEAGGDALPDYELLELVLFRAIPRRDVKPIAKELIRRFGSFAEVLAAPPGRLIEVEGMGESVVTDLKVTEAAAPHGQGRGCEAAGAIVLDGGARLLPRRHGVCREGTVPAAVPRQAQRADRRRGPGLGHRRPHTGLPARGGEARARASASALILVHNHPSGDPTPSAADIKMTREIAEIAKPLGIAVHDHIIVGREGHASFKGLQLI